MGAVKNLMIEAQENCIEILRATSDGNDLTPDELRLVERGVNGDLTFERVEKLAALHRRVVGGAK